jgi:hypothetical protein
LSRALPLTPRLRDGACVLWSLGLAVLAFDFLSLPIFDWKASASYFFFGAAAFCLAWAEKREFGSRVALYRLHDLVIYSPWRFLLLYFLWISVFSPFTSRPLASLVYATNGWASLLLIALTAQLVFSERAVNGIVLVPSRLALAFWSYSLTVSLLLANVLFHLFAPSSAFPMLVNEQANLFLYFTLGLPYLLWDFLKDGRRLLPRWLSGITVLMGAVTTLLLNHRFYASAIALTVAAVFGLFVLKKIGLRRALLLGGFIAGWGLAFALLLLLAVEQLGLRPFLDQERLALTERMRGNFLAAVQALTETYGLGTGLGLTSLRGVWTRVLAEAGVVGFALYLAFFLNMLLDLYRVRRSARVVVSNVSFVSLAVFLFFVSVYIENPYGAYVWVWYAFWGLFASTAKKREGL